MTLAVQTLDRISQDPEVQRLVQEREDQLRLYELDLRTSKAEGRLEGKAEGRLEGRVEGRAELMLKLVGLRFGPPSEATRARVEKATLEQLDAWAERILTARSLDDIFDP